MLPEIPLPVVHGTALPVVHGTALPVVHGTMRAMNDDYRTEFQTDFREEQHIEELNEVVYIGLAKPSNNTIMERSELFKPEYATAWAKYDPKLANTLLDEAGLGKRGSDGIRLLPDGTPAPGNPFASQGGNAAQVWSLGHRNVLGLKFDTQGRLWDLEHGPAGGDELNLVKPGQNYGWPLVSNGDHYGGKAIPRHATRPEFAAPAISWNPVIAPGDFIF